jgi:hypothetical protein
MRLRVSEAGAVFGKNAAFCICMRKAAPVIQELSHRQAVKMERISAVFGKLPDKCDNARLQLKKSKRITVRHFYSLVPMSVVSSPKATSQESSPGAPKVFR